MSAYAARTDFAAHGVSADALEGIATGDQDKALEAASRLVDSYLIKRFAMPLTAVGEDVKEKVCALAAYKLLKGRGFNPESDDARQLREDYDDALSWLRDVSAGRATPVGVTDSSRSGDNTDGDELSTPFVVQARNDDNATPNSSNPSPTVISTPRRRGW